MLGVWLGGVMQHSMRPRVDGGGVKEEKARQLLASLGAGPAKARLPVRTNSKLRQRRERFAGLRAAHVGNARRGERR